MKWCLNSLYESFDSDFFQKDLNRCKEISDDLNSWSKEELINNELAKEKISKYLTDYSEFKRLLSKIDSFSGLSLSVESKNEQAQKYYDKSSEVYAEMTAPTVRFAKWLKDIENLDSIIDSDAFLKEHSFFLKELKEEAKYFLSDEVEIVISKLQQSGSDAWGNLYNSVSSLQKVELEIDGKKEHFPLPIVRNFAYEKDPEKRKVGYEAELKSYASVEDALCASVNAIKKEVLEISSLRGYQSPLEQNLKKARIEKDVLTAMLSAMKESLPKFHKFLRKKAELLGHQNGLPFYDLFAPMGESDLTFSYDEAKTFIVDKFKSFDGELAKFSENAFEKSWIDALPRDGKRGGGFCDNLVSINESRILTNFTGAFSDISTLAHELGHAFHGHCLRDERILNTDYTMPIAETASIFCENIIHDAFMNQASDKEKITIIESKISDAVQVIVDIYSRYMFESNLFERRKESSLSVNELKDLMTRAQKEAFGNGLDHNFLHPYMWACKPHYYSTLSFYNYPYAFGLLFANGLYSIYLEEGAGFVSKYKSMLSVTGKMSIKDVAMSVGIDITRAEFWKNSLNLIEKSIDEFCG